MRAALAVATLLTITAPDAFAAVQQSPLKRTEDLRPELAAGKARTRLALAQVVLGNFADRGRLPATLGEIVAEADTTISRPLSMLQLTGVQADDRKAVEWQRDNSSPNAVGYKDGVPDLDRGGVKTGIALGGWGATTEGREVAVAKLGALEGSLHSNKIGLKSSIGERGFVSELTREGATSRVSVTLEGFTVDLAALLPFDLVGMPFGMSYELTEELDLPMPEHVQQSVDQFGAVVAQMELVDKALAVADEAEARLAARMSQVPGLADVHEEKALAQAALDAALADVEGATDAVADAEALLAAASAQIPSAEAVVADAQAVLDAAQADLDAAQAVTADAADRVATLQAELDALQAEAASDPVKALLLAPEIAAKELELDAAQEDLQEAQAAEADPQAAVDAASATVADAEAALADARLEESVQRAARDAARAALNAVEAVVDAARDRLALAQLAYDAAADARSETDEEIAALRADAQAMKARLAVMFVELRGLLEAMPDILGLQETLLDALEATPVLKVGALHLTSEAAATAEGGRTFTECKLSGIEVLGKPIPTLTCEDLASVREEIETRIEQFLTVVAGRPVQGVVFEGPVATTSVSDVPDERGFHRASVHFTPLRVNLPTTDIQASWDTVMRRLGDVSGMLLGREDLWTLPEFADVPTIPLVEVPVLALGVPSGGRVRVYSEAVGRVRIADGPMPLANELQRLDEQFQDNPPAAPVEGDTPDVDAELGGLDNDATFRPANFKGSGGGGGAVTNPTTPGTPGAPGNGAGIGTPANGAQPAADGDGQGDGQGDGKGDGGDGGDGHPLPVVPGAELPHTGGGASAALAGMALALGGLALRRRP